MVEGLIFDREGVMARVGDDVELFRELLEMFFADFETAFSSLASAGTGGDAKAVKEQAHALKSALGNLGAKRASDAAFALERAGAAGDLGKIEEHLARFKADVLAYKEAIKEFLS